MHIVDKIVSPEELFSEKGIILWTYCGDVQGSEIERAYFWVLEDVVEYFNRAENPEG